MKSEHETPWHGFLAINRAMRSKFLSDQPRKDSANFHWNLLQALLERAAFQPTYIPGKLLLERGDLCASERELAQDLECSRPKVQRALAFLEDMGEVLRFRHSRRRGAVIRLVRHAAWTQTKPQIGTDPLSSQRNGPNRSTREDGTDPPSKEVPTEEKNSSSYEDHEKMPRILETLKAHGCTVSRSCIQRGIDIQEAAHPGEGVNRVAAKLAEVSQNLSDYDEPARYMGWVIRSSAKWAGAQVFPNGRKRRDRDQEDLDDLFESCGL